MMFTLNQWWDWIYKRCTLIGDEQTQMQQVGATPEAKLHFEAPVSSKQENEQPENWKREGEINL